MIIVHVVMIVMAMMKDVYEVHRAKEGKGKGRGRVERAFTFRIRLPFTNAVGRHKHFWPWEGHDLFFFSDKQTVS